MTAGWAPASPVWVSSTSTAPCKAHRASLPPAAHLPLPVIQSCPGWKGNCKFFTVRKPSRLLQLNVHSTSFFFLLCLNYIISSSIPNNWTSRVLYTVRTYRNVSTEDFESFPTLTKPSQYLRHGYTPGTSARLCYVHSSVNKSQCELFREQRREELQILPWRGQEALQSTMCKQWRKKYTELGSSLWGHVSSHGSSLYAGCFLFLYRGAFAQPFFFFSHVSSYFPIFSHISFPIFFFQSHGLSTFLQRAD